MVVSIGRVVEPIMNWFEAVFRAAPPIAIELEKPPVEVDLPIKIEKSSGLVVLLTVSLAPAC